MLSSNENMVDYLVDIGALYSTHIIEAFRRVDRADFVLDASIADVYEDYPLGIGAGQTISQPRTVAMMMEMLSPQKGDRILDIGSGSGWTTAILASIAGNDGSVTGLERVEKLVAFGNKNLKKYNFKNAKIIKAGDTLGREDETFDCILVSAAASEFPSTLLKQLKKQGTLVVPVGNSIHQVIRSKNGEIEDIEHYGFRFVPLIY